MKDLINFPYPATDLMDELIIFDNFLLYVIISITLLVTFLMLFCVFRYNKKFNPVPATFTHNPFIEIVWTIVPIVILVSLIPSSLKLLYRQQNIPESNITIKATGNQWYWTYDYVDHGFSFDSYMLARDELTDYGFKRNEYLLATDNSVIVPLNKIVTMQITASDVIHAWTILDFGVKQDAVPGRLAELWFKAKNIGVYFGQCSELCGKDHSYMPITVEVVSDAKYEKWLEEKKKEV